MSVFRDTTKNSETQQAIDDRKKLVVTLENQFEKRDKAIMKTVIATPRFIKILIIRKKSTDF